ncbi:MAG TPA: response regulator transcription factor [Kofleriaceae bacterium]|jgi:DNA-binding NarL/FixJ family response regulator
MVAIKYVDEVPTAASRRTRVLLVDDHPVFRLGIATLLAREPDFDVVGQASTADEAIEMFRQTRADLVVIDIMLGTGSGIALVRELLQVAPTRVLGLSVLDEPVRVAEMLRAGAVGFAHKTQAFDQILDAIRATVAGSPYVPAMIRDEVERLTSGRGKLPIEQLTLREREVFALLTGGQSNDQIAAQLQIRPRTVETHRQRVMKKLGAHSLADLVRLATRWGVNA